MVSDVLRDARRAVPFSPTYLDIPKAAYALVLGEREATAREAARSARLATRKRVCRCGSLSRPHAASAPCAAAEAAVPRARTRRTVGAPSACEKRRRGARAVRLLVPAKAPSAESAPLASASLALGRLRSGLSQRPSDGGEARAERRAARAEAPCGARRAALCAAQTEFQAGHNAAPLPHHRVCTLPLSVDIRAAPEP